MDMGGYARAGPGSDGRRPEELPASVFHFGWETHRIFGAAELSVSFSTRKELMVVPELEARVTILGANNEPVVHLGQGPANYREVRLKARDVFMPGQFVAPHGACFDTGGNVFVVEWVEVLPRDKTT